MRQAKVLATWGLGLAFGALSYTAHSSGNFCHAFGETRGRFHDSSAPVNFLRLFDLPEDQMTEGRRRVPEGLLSKTLFIVPSNDGESVRAHQILDALNAPHVIKSLQTWGATLDKEKDWQEVLRRPSIETVVVFEMPGRVHGSRAGELSGEELIRAAGKKLKILDHHWYAQADRTRPESSLEQLMDFLHWPASETDREIAANDAGYIPALRRMGLSNERILELRTFDLLGQRRSVFRKIKDGERAASEAVARVDQISGIFVLGVNPLGVESAFIKQALALQTPNGIADILTFHAGGFGYSGSAELAKRLLALDFYQFGLRPQTDFDHWGGGLPPSGFFGFKTYHPRAAAILKKAEFQQMVWRAMRPDESTVPNLIQRGFQK